MSSKLFVPRPLSLLALIHDSHTAAQFTLDSPHTTALLALLALALDIGSYHESFTLQSPLRTGLLDPVDSLTRATTATSLHLLFLVRMSAATAEQLGHLHHSNIRGKGGHFGFENAGVHGCFVVLVLGQFGPETAEDAVACAGQVRGG